LTGLSGALSKDRVGDACQRPDGAAYSLRQEYRGTPENSGKKLALWDKMPASMPLGENYQ